MSKKIKFFRKALKSNTLINLRIKFCVKKNNK